MESELPFNLGCQREVLQSFIVAESLKACQVNLGRLSWPVIWQKTSKVLVLV